MAKGTRLSKENYCTHCEFRIIMDKKTLCNHYNTPVNNAMKICNFLKPFDLYREYKENKESVPKYKQLSI